MTEFPPAQFAFKGFAGFRVANHNPDRAIFNTEPAGNAFIFMDDHNTGGVPCNGSGRADIQAIGILALVAYNGKMV